MAKKLKIAILNITQGGVQRGAEAFVDGLSERLSESHKVEIFTDGRRKMPKRWPVVWRCYLDPYGLAVLWFTLRNLARIWRGKYDVVIPVNGGWEAVLVRLMTWTYGSKIVISGHSGRGWDDRINLWCMPDVFVALTRDGLRWAKRACPFVRVERIVNGVDLEKFKPDGNKYEQRWLPRNRLIRLWRLWLGWGVLAFWLWGKVRWRVRLVFWGNVCWGRDLG